MPPRQEEPPHTTAGVSNANVAGDHALVGAMVGVNNGTIVHHTHLYHVDAADPPEERFRAAVRNLTGGIPSVTEGACRRLLDEGHQWPELAYYYVLSLFSDRSPGDLDDVYGELRRARSVAERTSSGEWREAFDVVWQLGSSVWGNAPKTLDDAHRRLRALRTERQEEIEVHLELVLASAATDSLEATTAARARKVRMDGDRLERAWKFFEPDPAEPRQLTPEPTTTGAGPWVRAAIGAVSLLLGVLAPFSGLGTGNLGVGVPGLLVFLLGAVCTLWFGLQRDVQAGRLERREREHGVPLDVQRPVSPGHWVTTAFVEEIHRRVEARFREARPHLKGEWRADTRGTREYLKWRLVTLYGNAHVDAGQVDWLIRWHAERVARQWRAGTLFAYRAQLRPSSSTVGLLYLGVTLAVAGVLVMAGAYGGFALTAVLLGAGTLQAVRAATAIVAAHRYDAEAAEESRQLAEEETRGYGQQREVIADRPTDLEMAHWLNQDRSYLRSVALERYSLTAGDLVTHAVLAEGRSKGRARVVGGPWRYESYRVLVFLLTKSGVREIAFDLDFLTGKVGNERRRTFRYDALASARVSEDGARQPANAQPQAIADRVVRSRTFKLSLLSGETIEIRAKGYADPAGNTPVDESAQLRTRLVSSGIAGALSLLETVTAEGGSWIAREQERRHHRANWWQAP